VADEQPNFYDSIEYIASWYQWYEKFGDRIIHVRKAKDIELAKKKSKLGIILGFQSTKPIENNIDFLDIFHKLGVRIMQLTYQRMNWVGSGCGERTDSGLSGFGIEVIKKMNKLGILIDLSHCGDRTVMEAIEVSEKPVAFTHANPRGLCNVVRNKSDEQIKALAEKGGVISLNLFAPFYEKATKSTLDDLLDMIDHVNKVAGINHIGLGFDFDPLKTEDEFEKWAIEYPEGARGAHFDTRHPKGMENISFLPQLTIGLLKRGYSEQEVKKILGGNNLDLFRKVWGE
jgi:membrane dipeptidase